MVGDVVRFRVRYGGTLLFTAEIWNLSDESHQEEFMDLPLSCRDPARQGKGHRGSEAYEHT
jgi:hypothetical protein